MVITMDHMKYTSFPELLDVPRYSRWGLPNMIYNFIKSTQIIVNHKKYYSPNHFASKTAYDVRIFFWYVRQ